MIKYIRRTAFFGGDSVLRVSPKVLLHALERNFNGICNVKFTSICAAFLSKFMKDRSLVKETLGKFCRHPMNVLQDSLSEVHPEKSSRYNLPRYKMIIDDSNDDSVVRLLQMSGVLNSSHAFYKLSGLKDGAEIEQLNLVSRVKFAAQQGDKTVVMSQIEDVSECFYDLFNQHFKEFENKGKKSYFANIALGGISRPCIVDPSFQCIVHVQSSQLDEIPAPYLNRFEKFQISVDDILSWQISKLPPGIDSILSSVLRECEGLLFQLGPRSIWSSSPSDTLKSIFISMMRLVTHSNACQPDLEEPSQLSIPLNVLRFVKHWLVLDLSEDDIHKAIEIAFTELSGADKVDLRKVLDKNGLFAQSQLDQTFHDMASGKRSTTLSRSLEKVVYYAILRRVVFQLLQVAMPEAVFLQQ